MKDGFRQVLAGFIGADVAQALLDVGCEVVGVDTVNGTRGAVYEKLFLARILEPTPIVAPISRAIVGARPAGPRGTRFLSTVALEAVQQAEGLRHAECSEAEACNYEAERDSVRHAPSRPRFPPAFLQGFFEGLIFGAFGCLFCRRVLGVAR